MNRNVGGALTFVLVALLPFYHLLIAGHFEIPPNRLR
jgi:hypothetical protein